MVAASEPSSGPRALRRDAEANRQRLLSAAVTAVLREGRAVSMSTIADEAGVGIGTLYRRYPTREDLFEALQLRSFDLVIAMVRDIESMDLRGVEAVREFLTRTVAHGAELVMTWHGAPQARLPKTRHLEGELHGRVAALVERAARDGSVRPDLSPHDLMLFGALVAQPLPNTEDWDSLAHRQIAIFIQGVRSPDDTVAPPSD